MEEALRARLQSSSAVVELVPASRINWGAHPQGTGSPYITMMVVSDAAGLTLKGSDKLSEGRVQVDCYAPSYGQAKAISRAVRDVLHGFSATHLRLVSHVATRDSREGGTNEADRLHRVSMDFTTHWRQT